MKLRQLLISTAMMSLTFVSVNATTPALPSPLITEDKILGSAYYDTLSILSTPNECSEFFGGALISVEIFNSLIGQVRKEYLSSPIGIRMTGPTINVSNAVTNSRYRLFDKVLINANGPFYRRQFLNAQTFVPGIGSFKANSKEGRVLMFLHELGHIIKGESGKWLLQDDGRDDVVSRNNTKKIEDVCGNQIKNLSKGDNAMSVASGKQTDEKHAVANTKPDTKQ
jgi:hypothetical protein